MLAALNLMPSHGGVKLELCNPGNGSKVTINLAAGLSQCRFMPEEIFPQLKKKQTLTFSPPELKEGTPVWATLKRTEASWIVYINDQAVAWMPELWEGPVIIRHPPEAMPPEDDRDDYTQKLGHFVFSDNFLVPAGSEFPATWEKMAGIWKLHSVTGSISGSSGGYQLARQPRPEKSPNFYTLEGGGTNALVLAGEPFYSRYRYRAAVQHNVGTNGIAFLAPERGGYYAFTTYTDPASDRLVLELWRQPAEPDVPRVYLDAVQTELPAGQWLALEVRLFDDRIVCLADNIEVIRRKMLLPPGGRFGLYANTPDGETTRFDDVTVASHEDQLLETPGDIHMATRDISPAIKTFYHRDTTWLHFPAQAKGAPLLSWTTGAPDASPLRTRAFFVAEAPDFTCGILCGATNNASPYYRFTCSQREGKRKYVLEEVSGQYTFVQDTFETEAGGNRVTLTLDALRPNELRASADGQVVCFARPAHQPGGIQGIVAASEAGGVFAQAPEVTSVDDTMVERFEKNPLYVNDPFMRHWASPEGQWVTFPNGQTWFKGDLTGPATIRLPVVEGMDLQICVPEGGSNGLCRVSVQTNVISVTTIDSEPEPAFTVPVEKVPEVTQDKIQARIYTIGINGSVVWLGGDEILLGSTHVKNPLTATNGEKTGRRIRISGMALENLAKTLVKRDNVFDTLFTESLFNWTLNGGRWEVINRFYCEPTWSHMNGESADSLAALWSKYVFHGDFSIEFYAGMRMGWYGRPGDLNLTVMSRRQSTGDGYTAIATGWDPDHSQLYSRLLRNGKPLDISTKYLVPRSREGLVRQGYQPLVAKGRDIHGAWYGMQLRRIGNHLKYIYDNEEVFNVDDPEPLQDGSLGIWTFRNSMMVARIKIAAESIKPRPFRFHAIPAGQAPAGEPLPPPDNGLRVNGRVAQPLSPLYWESYDTVSHPSIRFTGLDTPHPEMKVTSLLGGGTFLAQCNLPQAETNKLLGWRFEMARHPDARVNFEFTSFDPKSKTEKTATQGWSYVLSGSDETRGPRRIAGKIAELPPSEGTNLVWTPVEVWVPSEVIRTAQPVKIDGFGNLQPSDVQQGLLGNPPGAWFAIRNFREIHRGIPAVSGPAEKRTEVAELAALINSLKPGELQMVEVKPELDPNRPVIEWAVPEQANFGLVAKADAAVPGSILITPTHPWPSPLLPPKQVTADTHPSPYVVEGDSIRVLIPFEWLQPQRMTLAVQLADGRYFRQVVPMRGEGMTNYPPVLLGLEMPEGGLTTFEQRPYPAAQHRVAAIATMEYADPVRGGVLKFRNNGVYGRRLSSLLIKEYDHIATPIIQFRYKGDPMAHVSMNYGGNGFSFTESYHATTRHGMGSLEEGWHTWMAIPIDNYGLQPLTKGYQMPNKAPLKFASQMSADQTGLHSYLMIDDLACGPAVGPNRPFAFKADYADPDGVKTVTYAIATGEEPYSNRPEERQEVTWHAVENGAVVQPDITELPDGIHHLVVRACDTAGLWSEVSDVPFMLDREPPKLTYTLQPCNEFNGSRLDLVVSDPVAPPIVNTLSFACLGHALDLTKDNGNVNIGCAERAFQIDWIWMLRNELEQAKQGDVLPIQVSGIVDAAGNLAEPVRIDIPLDLESDTRPPTILPSPSPTNTFWFLPQISTYSEAFTGYNNVVSTTVETPDGAALDLAISGERSSYVQKSFATPWDPEKFPWLAISFRTLDISPKNSPFSLAFHAGQRRPKGVKDSQRLDLALPENASFIYSAKSPDTWKTNEWHDVLINVKAFLAAESSEKTETPDITYFGIYFKKRLLGHHIQIRSIAILNPWNSNQTVTLRAYDLNSIKGMIWDGGETPFTGIRPANVARNPELPYSIRLRVSDRRGNMTPMWTIPIPPGSTNNLPAKADFFKVEY
ncbi:MAG: hypothetical protein J6334_13960 [Kiritimatiellae bacterium]|nr:hypothetical protein [Kiritimatiellia bacterium]